LRQPGKTDERGSIRLNCESDLFVIHLLGWCASDLYRGGVAGAHPRQRLRRVGSLDRRGSMVRQGAITGCSWAMVFTRTPLLYLWVVVLCRGQVVATTEHDETIVYADIGAQMPWVFFGIYKRHLQKFCCLPCPLLRCASRFGQGRRGSGRHPCNVAAADRSLQDGVDRTAVKSVQPMEMYVQRCSTS